MRTLSSAAGSRNGERAEHRLREERRGPDDEPPAGKIEKKTKKRRELRRFKRMLKETGFPPRERKEGGSTKHGKRKDAPELTGEVTNRSPELGGPRT